MTAFRLVDSQDVNTKKILSNIETFIENSFLDHDKYEIIQVSLLTNQSLRATTVTLLRPRILPEERISRLILNNYLPKYRI